MSARNNIGIVIGLLLIGGLVWFFVGRGGSAETFKLVKLLNLSAGFGSAVSDTSATASLLPSESSSASSRYTHSAYGFSFDYPEGLTVSSFEEGGGEVILAEGKAAGGGFQIYITPFDEPGPITAERIRQDLPDMIIHDPQRAAIGGADALIFFSEDPSLGKLREAWFSRGGYLYQVTAPAAFDGELSKIMATFAF